MNRLKIATATLAVSLLLAACTSYNAYHKAQQAEQAKNWDDAVTYYEQALQTNPGNMGFRMALQRARLEGSRVHFEKGKTYRTAAASATGNEQLRLAQLAATELELTVRLDPTNQYAAVELGKTVQWLTDAARVNDGQETLEDRKRRAGKITKAQPPQLNPASDQPISLSFPRETPVKDIYRALGNAFGINILFDQAVKDDRIAIELKDVTAQQALERLMQAANHFYKVLDEHTIIVVPDNPQARRDYEDLVIRTFYLSNGDAEQVTNVVRTMIEARNVFPLKALNAITIRDTADKVQIAEKIIEANDKARSEVVIDVELLEMDANKERNLGLAVAFGSNNAISAQLLGTDGKPLTNLTLDQIRSLSHQGAAHGPGGSFPASAGFWNFTIPSVTYNLLKTAGDSEVLAQPQLRISEGEKATLHIGDRIPVPVTSLPVLTAGGTSNYTQATTFQYQDTGIKVSIEPRVHHNREVTLKLTVEVSNVSSYVSDPSSGNRQPIISTRTIESTIRLKDGETNFLAGLIQRGTTNDGQSVPFLGDIPVLGRLFSSEHKTSKSTDLILTMTPHIIRIPDITDDDLAPMWVGTTNNLSFRGVSPRVESQSGLDPFSVPPAAAQFNGAQLSSDGEPGNYIRPDNGASQQPAPSSGGAAPGSGPSPNRPPEPEAKLDKPAVISGTPLVEVAVTKADGKSGYMPQGTTPTDVFKTASASAATSADTKPYVPQGSGPTDIFSKPTLSAASAAAAEAQPEAAQHVAAASPRLSPQPVNMSLKPGEEKLWSLVGMDLDGLTANQIVLHYDPHALDVADVAFGSALVVDATQPPVVAIDRANGSVKIASADGKPLQFNGGGQVAILRVHGGLPGETFLVLDDPALKNNGRVVASVINGGRARVQ